MNLKRVRDALLTVGVPVSHYKAAKQEDKYIVWAEDGQGSAQFGDGRLREQSIEGTAHYFTRAEYDPNTEKIQQAFGAADISFRLNSIQHEDDTGYTHYEWVWEVC